MLFDGACTTSIRPHGLSGRPGLVFAVSSVHVLPPSGERNMPLPLGAVGPSPPLLKVQPLRRKYQSPAKTTLGSLGSKLTPEHPVDGFGPFKINAHDLPPSTVR